MELESMDLESNIDSPPSSPILGYSTGRTNEGSIIEPGVVYCFSCKGPPKSNDFSFSPDGYILRREVVSAIENLQSSSIVGNPILENCKSRLIQCFEHHLFDPLEKDELKMMISLCRKNISTLEILSESAHALNIRKSSNEFEDPDDISQMDPWILRKNVCIVLNYIVRQLGYYRLAWGKDDLEDLFLGLKKSLVPVKDWSDSLKAHCGFKNGNECTAASYHFFHLQMELRWSLFIIFGVNSVITGWILDDLIYLAWCNYNRRNGIELSICEKQPFNCLCIKELWCMILLLIEELEPKKQQSKFWNFYQESMQRQTQTDVFFPIWLTAHLSPLTKYTVAGVFTPEKNDTNNGYEFLRVAFKEWGNHGGKSSEVLQLSFQFLHYWGGDYEIITALWNQWVPRLDSSRINVNNFESYCSVENWLRTISKLSKSSSDDDSGRTSKHSMPFRMLEEECMTSNKDPFMLFVRIAVVYAISCPEKDLRRFLNQICMKLSNKNPTNFGELGIIRTSTLILSLISAVNESSDREAVSLGERLLELFPFTKVRDTPCRRKTVVRAYSCAIIILLQRNLKVLQFKTITSKYMGLIDELLAQSSSASSPLRKELVVIYINFLECLSKLSPSLSSEDNLERNKLISTNLLMWLSQCEKNYTLRMIQALDQLTTWIISWISSASYDFDHLVTSKLSSCEAKDLFLIISEKSLPYMKSIVSSSQIPSIDLQPLCNLAGNITFLTRRFLDGVKAREECVSQFDLFALHEDTPPLVSQHYVQRLFQNNDFFDGCFPPLKLHQCWLRLVFLNCVVSDTLTEQILDDFASTSNEDLLSAFCTKLREWKVDDVQKVVLPLIPILKSIMDNKYSKEGNCDKLVESVIKSWSILLLSLFDALYIKGHATSCVHQFIYCMFPPPWPGTPPWEKFSDSVMQSLKSHIFSIFKAVVSYPSLSQDSFLNRKLGDIVALAFFGFVRDPETVNKNEHPALKILNYCEDHEIAVVQTHILPEYIAGNSIVEDSNSNLRHLFLRVVDIMRTAKFPTLVMRVLPGIIRIYPKCALESDKRNLRSILSAIYYCCVFGTTPAFKDDVVNAFNVAFERDFSFKAISFINLVTFVSRGNVGSSSESIKIKKFLLSEIIPLLENRILEVEAKRGLGEDQSLRRPLKKLKDDLQKT